MEPERQELCTRMFPEDGGPFRLALTREDYSSVYPGMLRYVLRVTEDDRTIALFVTNTYEYSPLVPLSAENAARSRARAWAEDLAQDPAAFARNAGYAAPVRPHVPAPCDLVILQGSPRPDGNSALLALWAKEAANDAGKHVRVIYPHDLDIHCCTGCYQCYNTGACVFDDDMAGIIGAVRDTDLVIVCSPVYTDTVTGGLKLVIDRMQAYHAERLLFPARTGQKGLVFSVAGRSGEANFSCVTKVARAFLRNIGITPAGEILIDRTDAVRDIRTIPGLEERVKALVRSCLP